MSTKTVRIADHMQIKPNFPKSHSNTSGRFDGQASKPVSMVGANKVSLALTVHVDLTAPHSLDVIVEQSNDESNWFEKTPRSGPVTITPANPIEFSGISMAWVRAVFILDDSTPAAPSTGTVVTCDLSTSLE